MKPHHLGAALAILSVAAAAGCAYGGPPMVEITTAPEESRCDILFQQLVDADAEHRDEVLAATLEECSLEQWHQANLRYKPKLPTPVSDDPEQQLAALCADPQRSGTRVCTEAS